jgi:hypothetical protein
MYICTLTHTYKEHSVKVIRPRKGVERQRAQVRIYDERIRVFVKWSQDLCSENYLMLPAGKRIFYF